MPDENRPRQHQEKRGCVSSDGMVRIKREVTWETEKNNLTIRQFDNVEIGKCENGITIRYETSMG